jgi:hypothetical protein
MVSQVIAGEPTAATVTTDTSGASGTAASDAAAHLPYGAADVLKLSRAQVGEDVIASYVQNSGTAYNLTANDILYLRGAGVSDRIINLMQEQKKKYADQPAQTAYQPLPVYTPAPAPVATTEPAPAPTYVTAPETTYAQSAPASSVYVISYPSATYAYYYGSGYRSYCGYPYYGGSCGWWGPALSFSFAFGGHGCYHGGHHH